MGGEEGSHLRHVREEEVSRLERRHRAVLLAARKVGRKQLELLGRRSARAELLHILRLDHALVETQHAVAQLLMRALKFGKRDLYLVRALQVE